MTPLAVLVVVACCVLFSGWGAMGDSQEDLRQCYVYNGERGLYYGDVSVSVDGLNCIRWKNRNIPRESILLGDRDDDLEKNHCRDADGRGYPWCFVSASPLEKKRCPIPHCESENEEGGPKLLEDCYIYNTVQGKALYEGNVSQSATGRPCQRWSEDVPHSYTYYLLVDLVVRGGNEYTSNYCRDPDGFGVPWCMTTDPRVDRERCDVPYCPTSILRPGVVDLEQCYVKAFVMKTAMYTGNVSTTIYNKTCLDWSPFSDTLGFLFRTYSGILDLESEKNFCRDWGTGQPRCIAEYPEGLEFENCPVPACDLTEGALEAWATLRPPDPYTGPPVNPAWVKQFREQPGVEGSQNGTSIPPNGTVNSSTETVPPLQRETEGVSFDSRFTLLIATAVPCAVFMFLAVLAAAVSCRRRRAREAKEESAKEESHKVRSVEWLGTTVELFPYARLRFLQRLGKGNFGTVVKAEALDLLNPRSWDPIAVKTCKYDASAEKKREFLQEILLMRCLIPHENVVAYLGASQMPQTGVPVLLLELMPGGDLLSWLRSQRSEKDSADQEMTSSLLVSFACQVARGMAHLEAQKIAHRDLAARNVLLGDNNVCKVSDFGLARRCDEKSDMYQSFRGAMPLRWMAPESLREGIYTFKTDVWSYGVTVWEILTLGATPYSSLGVQEVVSAVQRGQVLEKPASCDEELFQVVSGCWRRQPDQRPSFAGLVASLDGLLGKNNEYINLDRFEPDAYVTLEAALGVEVV